MEKRPLLVLLGELALGHPKLVLMRGQGYYRIEDLLRWARKDAKSGPPEDRKALADPIYWHTKDERGKLLVKGTDARGGEFVAFVEPGSDIQTSVD